MSNSCIELGFLEKIEAWKLWSKFFPSKFGGRPAWLALDGLPKSEEIVCQKCGKNLVFLCQIYAPFSEKEECFHRCIFVFICRDGECSVENNASNLRVFRCQLPRDNRFFSFEPAKEDEKGSESPSALDYAKLCVVCGALGPKVCGGCKSMNYCSKEHQALDWKSGHKISCKQGTFTTITDATRGVLFPEYEIDLEPEELNLQVEKPEAEVIEEYEKLLKRGQPVRGNEEESDQKDVGEIDVKPDTDLVKMAAKETDKTFAKFRTRIMDYPDQILRYDRGGKPLLVSSKNIPESIPVCEQCGSERQFEFQIMPQVLVHMKVDSTGASIDWGTILVYTCKESCSGGSAYVPELVYKQDYTPDLGFLQKS